MFEEFFSKSEREHLFRLDHQLEFESGEAYDKRQEAYYKRKLDARERGEMVWYVSNFDSLSRVYELWNGERQLACVEDDGYDNYRSYVRDRDEGVTLLEDTESLIAAVEKAEKYWGLSQD